MSDYHETLEFDLTFGDYFTLERYQNWLASLGRVKEKTIETIKKRRVKKCNK